MKTTKDSTIHEFYSSVLLSKLINRFVKRGQKHKVERILERFFLRFTYRKNFSPIWLFLAVIEFHRPILTMQSVKTKKKMFLIPRTRSTLERLTNQGLKWIKEGVMGGIPRAKKKNQLKMLRKEAKILEKKVKTRGFILTHDEQELIQKARSTGLNYYSNRPLKPAIEEYFLESARDYRNSDGYRKKLLYHKQAAHYNRFHSFKR